MSFVELILLSIGLGMDAFAVSICKGISIKEMNVKKAKTIGLYFGIFQGLMPVIGYLLGKGFESVVINIDHWIAFILLSVIGFNMIREAISNVEDKNDDDISFKTMIVLSLATSIDALAIGITFAFLQVDVVSAVLMIGVITFVLCVVGCKIGNKFGNRFERKAEIVGGGILIFLGAKILVEHLGFFG